MKIGLSSMTLIPKYLFSPNMQNDAKSKGKNENLNSFWENRFLNWAEKSLTFAEEQNFDFIEMIIESPLNDRNSCSEKFIEICNNFKIPKTIHAPFIHNNIISADNYIRNGSIQEIIDIFDIAKQISAEKITFHPGTPTNRMSFVANLEKDKFLKSIKKIMEVYHKKYTEDFILCIENMPTMVRFFCKADEISNFFTFPEFKDLKLTLDTSHAWTTGGDSHLIELYEKMNKNIEHIHVVDNKFFDNDPHIAVGTGKINFAKFFKTILNSTDKKYDDMIVIEMPGIENTLLSRQRINEIILKEINE